MKSHIFVYWVAAFTITACFQATEIESEEKEGKSVAVNTLDNNVLPTDSVNNMQDQVQAVSQELTDRKNPANNVMSHSLSEIDKQPIETFDSRIDKELLAEKVSAFHFRQPEVAEVQSYTQDLTTFKAYLNKLDAYSGYIAPEKVAFGRARYILPRVGLGLDIIEHEGKLLALPIVDGPLYRDGFITPQYLLSIEGKVVSYEHFNTYKILAELKADKSYSIELATNQYSKHRYFNVVADPHIYKPLYSSFQKDEMAVFRIKEFSLDLREHLNMFLKENSKKKHIIIDLRHCIGGNPSFAVDALGYFLGSGKHVVTYHSKDEDKVYETVSAPYKIKESQKITLLTSEFTASAAELFIHALKHYRPNVKLVGKPTAGKCLAQKPYLLEDGGVLKLSVYELITPNGFKCEGKPTQVDQAIKDIELMPLPEILQKL